MSEVIELCEAALFSERPKVGQRNPPGEVSYVGYARVPVAALESNLHEILFPEVDQDAPVFVEAFALINGGGVVVAVSDVIPTLLSNSSC